MAMEFYKFDNEDTKARWNQCVNQFVAAAAQDLPTAGAAADPSRPLYCHCHTLFLCRTNSDMELNCNRVLDSVVVDPPGEPIVVSHAVITINKKTATCFYISNVCGLFKKRIRKTRMEYCVDNSEKRQITQFALCGKEDEDFKLILKANKVEEKKRKFEVAVKLEAEVLFKRWKEEIAVDHSSSVDINPIVQQVASVEIPLGNLTICGAKNGQKTLFVKLKTGWEVLSTGRSAATL